MKRLVLFVIVTLLALPSFSQGILDNYPAGVKSSINKGDAALALGTTHRQYYIANHYYTKAYEEDSSSVAVKYRYALSSLKIKDTANYNQCIAILESVATEHPDIATDIWFNIGLARMEQWVISPDKDVVSKRVIALDSAEMCFKKQISAGTDQNLTAMSQRYVEQCEYAKTLLSKRTYEKDVQLVTPMCTEYDDFDAQYKVQDESLLFGSLRPEKANDTYGLGSTYEYNIKDSAVTLTNNYTISLVTSMHPDKSGFLVCFDGNVFEYNANIKGRTRIEKPIKAINTKKYDEINATYAKDGNTIYFASNCPEGYYGKSSDGSKKDYDIYKITRTLKERKNADKPKKETWGKPEKVSSVINTPNDEVLFSQYKDVEGNVKFYLASSGHESMGGVDVFSVATPDGGETFETPQNMGYPINTSADELSFVVNDSGSVMYLTSDRIAGVGGRDIYSVALAQLPNDFPILCYDNSLFTDDEMYNSQSTPNSLLDHYTDGTKAPADVDNARNGGVVKVIVIDEDSNLIASSEVNIDVYPVESHESADKISTIKRVTNDRGETLLILPELTNSDLVAKKSGYMNGTDTLSIGESYVELEKILVLRKLAAGRVIVLKNVFFDYDKYTLRSASLAELEKVLQLMEEYPNMEIEIAGHTDIKGSDAYNKTLSLNRAKAVYNWLTKQGVSGKRMTYEGYGFHKPIATNDTDEGRQLNRRTEMKIKKLR